MREYLLIHPDFTDGGGDIVDAGYSCELQGHVGLLRAAVDHWLVDKGDSEAVSETDSAVAVDLIGNGDIYC